MTIPTQLVYTVRQFAALTGNTPEYIWEQIKIGRTDPNKGIPKRFVQKIGGKLVISHAYLTCDLTDSKPANVVPFPAPQELTNDQLDRMADRLYQRLTGNLIGRTG